MVSVLRLRARCFGPNNQLCCSGQQLSNLARLLEKNLGPINWFVSDVRPRSQFNLNESPFPIGLGTTDSLVAASSNVVQFESGVFVAVPPTVACPQLRSQIHTDDSTNADLGDALVEIRAFDSTFFEVITLKNAISNAIAEEFGGVVSDE